MSVRRYDTIALGLLKKEEDERRMANHDFFTSRGAYINLRYNYSDVIHSIRLEISRRTRWWCLICVIVYLARDVPAFVMYCVYGAFRSSLYTYRVYPGAAHLTYTAFTLGSVRNTFRQSTRLPGLVTRSH